VRVTLLLAALAAVSGAAAPVGMAAQQPAVTVSAAISLTDALTAIAERYGSEARGSVRFNFAASNTLARQIVNGAPVDIFISADEAQMDVVAAAGLINDGSRFDLLSNQLAVVVPSDRPRTFRSMREIADPALKRIAIGDPAAVPAGVYARQYLEQEGLWDQVAPRVVPSSSVRAALSAVESGAADAAIVYRTDARIAVRATVAWVVPADRGPRIRYPAAILRGVADAAAAQRFLDYVRGDAAARIFERFGFARAAAAAPR